MFNDPRGEQVATPAHRQARDEMTTCKRIPFPTPPHVGFNAERQSSGGRPCLLGTLLMALSGRSTRTVRMADRLMFCRSREYSTILCRGHGRVVNICLLEKKRKKLLATMPYYLDCKSQEVRLFCDLLFTLLGGAFAGNLGAKKKVLGYSP